MSGNTEVNLSRLASELTIITDQAQFKFGSLTARQLNWKPSAETWSIGQCFDHLVAANRAYIPIFEQVIIGRKQTTFWEKIPLLPKIFGKLLIKYLSPQSARKLNAPEVFKPSTSGVDEDIISRFIEQQKQMMMLMKRTEGFNLSRMRITSPAVRFITYSVMNAYEIIVVHEKRHFRQAERVLGAEGFPQTLEGPHTGDPVEAVNA